LWRNFFRRFAASSSVSSRLQNANRSCLRPIPQEAGTSLRKRARVRQFKRPRAAPVAVFDETLSFIHVYKSQTRKGAA
jgi:hypothetical protein